MHSERKREQKMPSFHKTPLEFLEKQHKKLLAIQEILGNDQSGWTVCEEQSSAKEQKKKHRKISGHSKKNVK